MIHLRIEKKMNLYVPFLLLKVHFWIPKCMFESGFPINTLVVWKWHFQMVHCLSEKMDFLTMVLLFSRQVISCPEMDFRTLELLSGNLFPGYMSKGHVETRTCAVWFSSSSSSSLLSSMSFFSSIFGIFGTEKLILQQ